MTSQKIDLAKAISRSVLERFLSDHFADSEVSEVEAIFKEPLPMITPAVRRHKSFGSIYRSRAPEKFATLHANMIQFLNQALMEYAGEKHKIAIKGSTNDQIVALTLTHAFIKDSFNPHN